jgi:hypothetical protein
MPADLAEAWFDLQDVVHESPATAGAKVEEFEDALGEKQEAASDEIRALERRYDENADRKVLEEIAGQVQARNYLHSLGRDVIRLKYRLQGKQSPWDA